MSIKQFFKRNLIKSSPTRGERLKQHVCILVLMPKTVFFFGRNPVLSLAELVSVLSIHEPDSRVHALWNNAALVEGVEKNPVSLLERLGGTTKIAQATTEWSGSLSEKGGVFFGEKFFDSFGEKFFFALSRLGKIS
jgi:hypothetical protein